MKYRITVNDPYAAKTVIPTYSKVVDNRDHFNHMLPKSVVTELKRGANKVGDYKTGIYVEITAA